jgi:peptidoglycan/xylan/chitin deacetylase (PgdA/CDA1 family)
MTQWAFMDISRRRWRWVGVGVAIGAIVVLAVQASVLGAPHAPAPSGGGRVALTFDDLPAHGPIPPGSNRVDIATRIIKILRDYQAPAVYGFINASDLKEHPDDEQVLRLWREAGFPLGNHAFTHMDLHANTVEAFEQDVLANEPTLRSVVSDGRGNGDWRWFRFPYLREGDTVDKHRQVKAFLKQHGYRVAEVTLSFDDYAYNDPYARCVAKQDAQAIELLQRSYLTRAADSLTRGQAASRALFGRDINHVMLLHIGGFETVMLPRLLDLLKERGFTLITLEEAERDPAYAMDPDQRDGWHGTLLDNLQFARGMRVARPTDSTFQTLPTLCK